MEPSAIYKHIVVANCITPALQVILARADLTDDKEVAEKIRLEIEKIAGEIAYKPNAPEEARFSLTIVEPLDQIKSLSLNLSDSESSKAIREEVGRIEDFLERFPDLCAGRRYRRKST